MQLDQPQVTASPPALPQKTPPTMRTSIAIALIVLGVIVGVIFGVLSTLLFGGTGIFNKVLNLTNQNGGEPTITITSAIKPEYCLSDDFEIAWSGSTEFEYVGVSLRAPSGAIDIGDFPFNEIDGSQVPGLDGRQTVKLSEHITDPTFQEEKLFELIVGGYYDQPQGSGLGLVADYSDRFAVRRCDPGSQGTGDTRNLPEVTSQAQPSAGGDQDEAIKEVVSVFSFVMAEFAAINNESYSGIEQCVATPNVATCKDEDMAQGMQEIASYLAVLSGQANSLAVFADEGAYCVSHRLVTAPGYACINAVESGFSAAVVAPSPCSTAHTSCTASQL